MSIRSQLNDLANEQSRALARQQLLDQAKALPCTRRAEWLGSLTLRITLKSAYVQPICIEALEEIESMAASVGSAVALFL